MLQETEKPYEPARVSNATCKIAASSEIVYPHASEEVLPDMDAIRDDTISRVGEAGETTSTISRNDWNSRDSWVDASKGVRCVRTLLCAGHAEHQAE